jgi:phosphoribosylformimino-5-aminoimidazole carboxamide ribotide isomerase
LSTVDFEILPAIDLRGGRVVRLVQGDFGRETDYGDDPVAVARRFVGAGARRLHVVDLDGARAGKPRQLALVRSIVDAVTPAVGPAVGPAGGLVELGGGLRSTEDIEAAIATGIDRVVLGSAALADPGFAARAVDVHGPDRVVVAVDVRDGRVVGGAWQGTPGSRAEDAVTRLATAGVGLVEATAIARDGTLEGPDLDLLGRLVALDAAGVIASGGIGSMADLDAVRAVGCVGAIVGRALYEGRIGLRELFG